MNSITSVKILRRALALAALATIGGANAAGGQDRTASTKILNEVAKACHAHSGMEVTPFFTITPIGHVTPTTEDETRYIAKLENFAHAQHVSACWTRDRWERFVHAVAAEDRTIFGAK